MKIENGRRRIRQIYLTYGLSNVVRAYKALFVAFNYCLNKSRGPKLILTDIRPFSYNENRFLFSHLLITFQIKADERVIKKGGKKNIKRDKNPRPNFFFLNLLFYRFRTGKK